MDSVTEIKFNKHRYHEHQDMLQWCQDNFGPGCWGGFDVADRYGVARTGEERWSYDMPGFGNFAFQFLNEQDAMLFSLRWQ